MSAFKDPWSRTVLRSVVVPLIVVSSFFLRLYQIDVQELWFDESVSFHMASAPNWLQNLRVDPHPPLYYLLLRGWVSVAGASELSLRFVSAVFGTFLVLAVMWVAKLLFNESVALWSALFAAVAPMHIYYSQEARSYAMLVLVLALTYGVLWRAMEKNTLTAWIAVFLCELTALYTHYLAAIALLPTVLVLVIWPDRSHLRSRWVGYWATAATSSILLLPWLIWTRALRAGQMGDTQWISLAWDHVGPVLAIPKTFEILAFGSHSELVSIFLKQMSSTPTSFPLRVLGLSSLVLLMIVLAVPWGDRRLGIPWFERRKFWVGSLFLFPLIVLWIMTFFDIKSLYVAGRYDMIVFPAFALLVGASMAKVQSLRAIGPYCTAALSLALFTVVAFELFYYYRAEPGHFARSTARVLDRYARNGDVVVLTGGSVNLPVLYYLYLLGYADGYCHNPEKGRRFSCHMFPPEEQGEWLGPEQGAAPVSGLSQKAPVTEIMKHYLSSRLSPENRFWIVFWIGAGGRRGSPIPLTPLDMDLLTAIELMGLERRHLRDTPWIATLTQSKDTVR